MCKDDDVRMMDLKIAIGDYPDPSSTKSSFPDGYGISSLSDEESDILSPPSGERIIYKQDVLAVVLQAQLRKKINNYNYICNSKNYDIDNISGINIRPIVEVNYNIIKHHKKSSIKGD